MMRTLTHALALATLFGLTQVAAAHDMQVLQGGENFEVQWTGGPRDNLAGGGTARLQGGGEDRSLTYEPATTQGQSAVATLSGGGDDRTLIRSQPQPSASMLAQGPAPQVPGGPRRR
jgi:hypothetical protein